ncbi:MAG: hypothetical protein E6H07_01825 [Bacteroidetes bacterium]|nr:MAG: hypothetical protein E6H07_01825 [Bacteroidota bacterium]
MKKVILSVIIFLGIQQAVNAQETKKEHKEFKNSIHFNLTNPFIFSSRSLVFGYERVLNNKRSFSVNFGLTGFPTLDIIDTDSLQENSVIDSRGFNFSADYRFYLADKNKYSAPRGLYIGPYYSYNLFGRNFSWLLKSTSGSNLLVESDLSLNVHTIGFEMGYQFVLWDRLTLDMLMIGPGIGSYSLKASLGTNLSGADKEKFFELLNDALAEKFPGYGFVIDEGNFKRTGTDKTTTWGYRYMVQVGFRF